MRATGSQSLKNMNDFEQKSEDHVLKSLHSLQCKFGNFGNNFRAGHELAVSWIYKIYGFLTAGLREVSAYQNLLWFLTQKNMAKLMHHEN